jgi:acyl transferase domain-containing protein
MSAIPVPPVATEALSPVKQALLAVRTMQAKLDQLQQAAREPIAVVGMGCRFPGGAVDPDAFWRLLDEGRDAVSVWPDDRRGIDADYDAVGTAVAGVAGESRTGWRRGAFLPDVEHFDAAFFGISAREAASLDPQQRLLLEVGWEALEHAGLAPDQLGGTRTGVFVGAMNRDYLQLQIKGATASGAPQLDAYAGTGNGSSFLAGRLSYFLGLRGPSITLDTACSSSLVAVHLACQSLRSGECDLALAGGVNVILSPEISLSLDRLRALSPSGACRVFDAAADGYVRGEGCGLLVLKRLTDARAGADPILGLIRGSAVNHGGASSGLTVPNGGAQSAVLREALAAAGVGGAEIGYLEAHGTGTPLGDPIEFRAFCDVLLEGRPADAPLVVGSVKTNLGHLESASGVASLIKTILAIRHGRIPAHLHLQQPNPHIDFGAGRVVVPRSAGRQRAPLRRRVVVRHEWRERPRRARRGAHPNPCL